MFLNTLFSLSDPIPNQIVTNLIHFLIFLDIFIYRRLDYNEYNIDLQDLPQTPKYMYLYKQTLM